MLNKIHSVCEVFLFDVKGIIIDKNISHSIKIPKDKHLGILVLLIIAPDFIMNLTLSIINVLLNDSVLLLNKEQPLQVNDVSDVNTSDICDNS